MNCPFCKAKETKVIDSRILDEGQKVRRRRKCEQCGQRFTTYEMIELAMPMILKNDGRREAFNREKLLSGVKKACQKRPISTDQIEYIIDEIEREIFELGPKEVSTNEIGKRLMGRLRLLDPVAYVRFASVYRTFTDVDEFVNELKDSEPQRALNNLHNQGSPQ